MVHEPSPYLLIMNIEEIRIFALSLPQVTEDMPYGPDWLVFRIAGKIFAHLHLDSSHQVCAVKLDPDRATDLREKYDAIRPAYHLNKVHWSDLYADRLEPALMRRLITESFLCVVAKLPKKRRETIPCENLENIYGEAE